MIEVTQIHTPDFGVLNVTKDLYTGFEYRVVLGDPRTDELFEAAKRLAMKKDKYQITYPYRFNSDEIPRQEVRTVGLPTVDQVVAKYLETRDELKRRQAELDEELKPLKEFQAKREQWLLSELNKMGANNVKTPHGTVYQTTTESVTMADWDSFFAYVQETKQFNLLTHAVNKTAALEIMGEERQNALPPGVNYAAIRTVNVRKS